MLWQKNAPAIPHRTVITVAISQFRL